MHLFIEPSDFLFCRDNRPFTAGEVSTGHSTLPLPATVYGAVRSWILETAGVDWATYGKTTPDADSPLAAALRVAGTPTALGTLALTELAVCNTDDATPIAYYPAPLDLALVENMKDKRQRYVILQPTNGTHGTARYPLPGMLPLLPPPDTRSADSAHGALFVSGETLAAYLGNDPPGNTDAVIADSALFAPDQRVGISITRQYVSEDRMFYAIEGLRFHEGYGLLAQVTGAEGLPEIAGWHSFGGKRRFSAITTVAAPDPIPDPDFDRHFKLVLTTPAVFAEGWRPDWIDTTGTGAFMGTGPRVQLVSAAVGRPVTFSGFDLAGGHPKPIRRAVPAGSVYHFRLLDTDSAALTEARAAVVRLAHGKAMKDALPETSVRTPDYATMGFGIARVGRWEPNPTKGE